MSGIRTAETSYIGENAEIVPEEVSCPAPEQQKEEILRKMLEKCRRWYYVRH